MDADRPSNREARSKSYPGLMHNVVSLLGAILAAISFANIVFLFLMAILSNKAQAPTLAFLPIWSFRRF